MCGICGIVSNDSVDLKNKEIEVMTKLLFHRGPDDHGYYVTADVALGHSRLSIIDLNSGPQPIPNETGEIQVVFNGEIFNYRELTGMLKKKGHQFSTRTDSEVIVHAYEEFGNECFNYFRGQFGIGIWDAPRQKLILARDRIGIKPVYYAKVKNKFVFASEIKSILKLFPSSPGLNLKALNRYLGQGYCWGEETMFEGVYKLLPGQYLEYQNSEIHKHTWYDLSTAGFETGNYSFEEYREMLYTELKSAVEMRLVSDVPIGAFLSGGVDSSILVALISELQEDKLNTFSVAFKNSDFDESSFARKIAGRYGTNHRELFGEENAVDILENVIWHLDEPISDQAVIPTYMLSKLTREHVTVALSGDGSDEILAGYNKFLALYYEDKYLKHFPEIFQSPFLKYLKNRIPYRAAFHHKNSSIVDRYFSLLSGFTQEERNELFINSENLFDSEEVIRNSIPQGITPLQQVQFIDTNYWLVNDILLKTDKMSMSAGLEVRVPYLDHKFVELSLKIEDKFKINMGMGKYILKKTFKDKLPLSIYYRKKQGFNYPLETVFSEEKVNQYFNDSPLYDTLKREKVLEIVKNRNSNAFVRRQFRNLFFLFTWHKIFMQDFNSSSGKFQTY